MNDPLGLEASGLPPELVAQLMGSSKRRAIAEAMLRQAMQAPEVQQPKGRFQGVVSPLEHIAKLTQGVLARGDMRAADDERAAIGRQAESGRKAAMEAYMKQKLGAPEVAYTDTLGSEPPQAPISPGVKADPRGALAAGFADPYLKDSKFLQMEQGSLDKADAREDQQAFLEKMAGIKRDAKAPKYDTVDVYIGGKWQKVKTVDGVPQLSEKIGDPFDKGKPDGASVTPYAVPVSTPQGIFAFDTRTKSMTPMTGPDGKPLMKATDDPTLQGQIKGAEQAAKGGAEANQKEYDAAMAATQSLTKVNELLNHLKTSDATTGIGAELINNVNRVKAQVTGDLKAGKKVSDTQILDAMMGSEVFSMIQALGVGARGLDTPAERDYMRQVLTGTIAMDKDALIKLAEIRRDIAQRAIDRFNSRVDKGELDDWFKAAGRTKERFGGAAVPAGAPKVRRWNPQTRRLEG